MCSCIALCCRTSSFTTATVAVILGARRVDIHRFHGTTTSGEPATPEHFRRYGYGVAAAAAALWILVHVPNFMGSPR